VNGTGEFFSADLGGSPNIQVEYLKIEVEKGFKQTLIELELVDLYVLINIENITINKM